MDEFAEQTFGIEVGVFAAAGRRFNLDAMITASGMRSVDVQHGRHHDGGIYEKYSDT